MASLGQIKKTTLPPFREQRMKLKNQALNEKHSKPEWKL
jgi:hypothetical protein